MNAFDDKEDQLTTREVASLLNIPVPVEKPIPDISLLTLEEIEAAEKLELYSSDIYRIAARVKNAARSGGGSLTQIGEGMCNMYVHVMKDLYDFADTLDGEKKEQLRELLRKHEEFPGLLINASRKR